MQVLGPLTKIAIADARGVCFEYAPRRIIRERNNWSAAYFPHHKFGTGNGRYSDDAQMTCAVAETLIECGPYATERDFAERFVRAFKREPLPREGYASAFFEFLKSVTDADDFLARIRPDSEKSGAAMRASPCGVLRSVELVKAVAARQAAITHNTFGGIMSAQAAALMCHYFCHDLGPRAGLPAFLDTHVPGFEWAAPHEGDVGPVGIDAVRAALTALMRNDTLADMLIDCVAFGGDVDTVATIAMGGAAWSKEIDQTLPQALWDDLEGGEFGRDYLAALDRTFSMVVWVQPAG